jgi:hypothetical protein
VSPVCHRSLLRVLLVSAVIAAIVPAASSASAKRALVTWKVGGETFRTYLNRAEDVGAVRAAIRVGESAGIPIGRIYRGARENRLHAWHLRNVRLVEVTIELCDGRPSDLDGDLGYWVGTVKRYCPWGARPVRLRWVT